MNQTDAINAIDGYIAMCNAEGDCRPGTFHGERHQFESGYEEAMRDGDDYVTIKLDSEITFRTEHVAAALGR